MNNIPFWLVWDPNGNAPTVKHETQKSAENEAERLARLNPNQCFYVLMPTCEIKRNDLIITRFENEDVPF